MSGSQRLARFPSDSGPSSDETSAAARCRVKKKGLVWSQNEELKSKVQQNTVLLETVLDLRTKAQWMAMMLAEHESCFDGST